ncbi:MAG: M48 family metalloprotease [Candidatus Aminicenantes bacterium]|nr:M48 family metalloprotease [Candidatus Aminicenantes bacterium]
MKKSLPLILCLFFAFTITCSINPVTGKKEISLISEQGEIAMGENTDKQVLAQYGAYQDPVLTGYVERLGAKLVPFTHRPHLLYHFAVLDSPVINAFAAPGGFIYVTRGALAMMNSEAELAVLLGHELGHVNARHTVSKMSQLILVQLGLAVGSVVSEEFAKFSGLASVGVQLLFLKFSRDDEREADRLGVDYSRSGGYNPSQMINFFSSLQALGDLSGGHSLPGFLSTHPLTSERIENTKALILESDSRLEYGRVPYLSQIENMIYGSDPRQGFVEGNTFYHPQMRFYFSIPQEWTVQNTPANVFLVSKDGNAAVVLLAEQSQDQIRDYAKKKASSFEGHILQNEQSQTINGMASYLQSLDVPQQEGENLRVILSCIKKGEYVYSFASLSTVSNFSSYDYTFRTVVGSFRELTNKTFLSRQPKRIKLVKANGQEVLQSIFQKAGMDKELWQKFAIMNGIPLDQRPESGRSIKILK